MGRQEGGEEEAQSSAASANEARSPKPAKFGEGLPLPQHGPPGHAVCSHRHLSPSS